jgi:hypothetical protein
MQLPFRTTLIRRDNGVTERAEIVTLSREDAKTKVDRDWWTVSPMTGRRAEDEKDHHWEWRELVSVHQNLPSSFAVCLRTPDGEIQGAMLGHLKGLSVLSPGERCVYVDRLATAPRNRSTLVESPLFRRCGTELLVYSVARSLSVGFGGRVLLTPIDREDFYTEFGFEMTPSAGSDGTMYELSGEVAVNILRSRGLIA